MCQVQSLLEPQVLSSLFAQPLSKDASPTRAIQSVPQDGFCEDGYFRRFRGVFRHAAAEAEGLNASMLPKANPVRQAQQTPL